VRLLGGRGPGASGGGRLRGAVALLGGALIVGSAIARVAAPAAASGVAAEADAFVMASSPTANRGTAGSLRIRNAEKIAYVRFTVPQPPPGATFVRATLRVFATTGSACPLGVEVLRAARDDWGETTITWNTQPGPTGPVLDTAAWPTSGSRDLDVSAAVSGPGPVSFVLRHAEGCKASTDAVLKSREATVASKRPQLVLETSTSFGSTACLDGIDNDGDGLTDHPDDPGCWGTADTREEDPSATLLVPEDYPTIQMAIDAASPGQVIDVAPGTYPERITIDTPVTIRGRSFDPADPRNNTTVLDGGGRTVVTVPKGVPPGLTLLGLVIRGGEDGIAAAGPLTVASTYFVGNRGDDIDYVGVGGGVCRGNVFQGAGDDAIDLDHPNADLVIEGNRILHPGDDGVEIRLHDDALPEVVDIVIRGNEIAGSGEDGVQVIDYLQDTLRRITIERNLIRDSRMAGIGLMDDAKSREDFRAASVRERILVFHNTFVRNDHGISGGDNLIALNNVFVGHVLALKDVDGDSVVSNVLFWENGTDATGSVVREAIVADPLLDPAFRPQAGSPAIDAGVARFEWRGEVVMDQPSSAYAGAAPDLGFHEAGA
jgi:hypothetical protein